jgi:hypothetical protein
MMFTLVICTVCKRVCNVVNGEYYCRKCDVEEVLDEDRTGKTQSG